MYAERWKGLKSPNNGIIYGVRWNGWGIGDYSMESGRGLMVFAGTAGETPNGSFV